MSKDIIKVLVEGWFDIPHSYAIVNCFHVYHWSKDPRVELYVRETEYYQQHWKNLTGTIEKIYEPDMAKALRHVLNSRQISMYKSVNLDVVMRIEYPYNDNPDLGYLGLDYGQDVQILTQVPKIFVFYTAEFGTLTNGYFLNGEVSLRNRYITPSAYSAAALSNVKEVKVIPHGVDNILGTVHRHRQAVREFYGVKDDEQLWLNIGAMTGNKGIDTILACGYRRWLEKRACIPKIMLKASGAVYDSLQFIKAYLETIATLAPYSTTETKGNRKSIKAFVDSQVIIINDTLSFRDLAKLYSAADVYVSPYRAEGFNMCILEALACGCPVAVPRAGPTSDLVAKMKTCDVMSFVGLIPCEVENMNNIISIDALDSTISELFEMSSQRAQSSDALAKFLETNYSWESISKRYIDHFLSCD